MSDRERDDVTIRVVDARIVADEGTIAFAEGLHETSAGTDRVRFAIDHRMAQDLPETFDAVVEGWQILSRQEVPQRREEVFEGPDPYDGSDGEVELDAAERAYERWLGRS